MALYSYKKAPIKTYAKPRQEKSSPTLATFMDNTLANIADRLSKIKPISVIFPLVFIISGITILYGQVKPYAVHFLQSRFSNKLNQEIVPLIPESYETIRNAYITDPGSEYFTELLDNQEIDKPNSSYTGTFYLTIEDIRIINAPVTANVNSISEESYAEALSRGLAHFKGTHLPNERGNTFLYGHSAAGDYAEKHPEDVVTAFTRLSKLNIGDDISIQFEGETYKYIIKKIKEINPDDTDVLAPQNNRKTLTLMTCSPPGLNSRRLVVVADQVNS